MTVNWRSWGTNGLLLAFSVLLVLAGVEIGLRLFMPKYQSAAESSLDPDKERIFKRLPNERLRMRHPDNGQPFWNVSNALGAHNHREFAPERLAKSYTIGTFGDSFTANHNMPVPFSFQEVLDYLLNGRQDRFDVLNYGVNGYGPDQSYRAWEAAPIGKPFDLVLYVFCLNDLKDIEHNNLFRLSDDGGIEAEKVRDIPWWVPLFSRFYTTYLVMEAKATLFALLDDPRARWGFDNQNLHIKYVHHAQDQRRQKLFERYRSDSPPVDKILVPFERGERTPELERVEEIFRRLMRRWKKEVEASGSAFAVVLLPRPEEDAAMRLFDKDIEVINLYQLFTKQMPGYDFQRDAKFKNDGHWGEQGNLWGAMHLYRFMEQRLGWATESDPELRQRLAIYAQAFPWEWPKPKWLTEAAKVDPALQRPIRRKYLELELPLEAPLGIETFGREVALAPRKEATP